MFKSALECHSEVHCHPCGGRDLLWIPAYASVLAIGGDDSYKPNMLKVVDLGLVSVEKAAEIQEIERKKVLEGESAGTLFFCEHPHTITLGRKLEKKLKEIRETIPEEIEVVPLNRGGELTYHGPGQLVIYPVFSIFEQKLSVKEYIASLENLLIRVLKDYGLNAQGNSEHRGVWIENQKVASVGVHISKGVAIHGLALNVSPNLKYFSYFQPCGLCHTDITSLEKILGKKISLDELKEKIKNQYQDILFGLSIQESA